MLQNKRQFTILVCLVIVLGLTGCSRGSRSSRSTKVDSNDIAEMKAQLSIIEVKLDSIIEKQEMAIMEIKTSPTAYATDTRRDYPAATLTKKEIQKALKLAGFNPGVIDGKMGKRTRTAIKDFQQAHGLKVDGVPGRKTQVVLRDYL